MSPDQREIVRAGACAFSVEDADAIVGGACDRILAAVAGEPWGGVAGPSRRGRAGSSEPRRSAPRGSLVRPPSALVNPQRARLRRSRDHRRPLPETAAGDRCVVGPLAQVASYRTVGDSWVTGVAARAATNLPMGPVVA